MFQGRVDFLNPQSFLEHQFVEPDLNFGYKESGEHWKGYHSGGKKGGMSKHGKRGGTGGDGWHSPFVFSRVGPLGGYTGMEVTAGMCEDANLMTRCSS